jgi:hypothetical protein
MGRSPCIFRRHCAPKRNAVSRECVVSAAPLAQFTSASRLRLPRGGDKARPQVLIQSCNARVTTSGPPSERTWRSGTAASFMKEVKSQFPPIWRSFRYTDIKLNGRAALVVVGPVWPFDPYPVEGASTRGLSDLAHRTDTVIALLSSAGKTQCGGRFLIQERNPRLQLPWIVSTRSGASLDRCAGRRFPPVAAPLFFLLLASPPVMPPAARAAPPVTAPF